tara:strand:+ start:817 stop:1692 length:876 start_codon:yes stop_codon:yes gene_type:complete
MALTQAGIDNVKNLIQTKYGFNLPDNLLAIVSREYVASGNDIAEAITQMRKSTEYAETFAGNLNPDGVTVKYSESEYLNIVDAYKRKIESLGVNSDLIMTSDRQQTLIENVVSPDEFGTRLSALYNQVVTSIPQVKEFYKTNFDRDLTDVEILASAIDPKVGQDIISGAIGARDVLAQRIVRAEIGGQALKAGFEISQAQADALRQMGISGQQAGQAFQQASQIASVAARQGRQLGQTDAESAIEIVEGLSGQEAEQRQLEKLLAQQQSESSAQLGAVRTRSGAVSGLTEE